MTFLACAAMLTSAFVLGSCNKNDSNEPKAQMPEVKTEFTIALPTQLKSGANRMPGTTVQKAGLSDFQGMEGIILIPYDKQRAITTGDKRIGKNINLAAGIAPTGSSGTLNSASNAKVFEDVPIPVSTASFLFYAKSMASGTKFEVGSLNATGLDADSYELEDIHFDLEQINTDPDSFYLAAGTGGKLMAYLTNVANATDGVKAWSEYTTSDNEALKRMRDSLLTNHALSSFEVARIMTDLYKSFKPVSSTIATAIKTAIENGAKSVDPTTSEVTLKDDVLGFPQKYGLPEGSVTTKWNSTNNKFEKGDYSNCAPLNRYVYPSQLWYYVNSQIKTSNSSKKSMYESGSTYSAILTAHNDGTSVSSRTRAVAVKDSIQYAVARLDVAVRLASSAMADNSDVVEGAATDVDCTASGFPVTAVLVGGQQQVKYDFTTNGGTEFTIYDNETTIGTAEKNGDAYSPTNSTLVLENGTSDVMIAVEMENDKADFYGINNQLIPKGSKFYVIAKLPAAVATETSGHVFKQDYTTTAKLTLLNLKKAYNTIPDLRTPQLELGFSVNLDWKSGHNYTVNFD